MIEKVRAVIESQIKPALAVEGGAIELIEAKDGVVKIMLSGACAGCPMRQYTLKNFIESVIKDNVPEVKEVVTL
jgi:Fe-S cluster biogenesis protein NfuA